MGSNAPPVIHNNGGDVQEEQHKVLGENPHLEEDVEQEKEQSQELPQVPPLESQVRRSSRKPQPSIKYSPNEYALLSDGGELESFDKTRVHAQKEKWQRIMQDEFESLHKNNTYELVQLPKG